MTGNWDIEDEWESVPMEKNEEINELPKGCMERVSKQAERNNMMEDKVLEIYFTYIKEAYGCDDPYSETDEELLNDWFEACFTKERRSGGGSNTVTFVGHFIGKDNSKKDRSQWVRNHTIKEYTKNSTAIIEAGKIGVYEVENNVWIINTKDGVIKTTDSADDPPVLGFMAGNDWLCLISKAGKPYPAYRDGRYAYFLGNSEDEFVKRANIDLWKIDLTGDCADMILDIGRAVKIQVTTPQEDAKEPYDKILGIGFDFKDTMEYTDEFVSEKMRPFLQASTFWTNTDFHNLFVPTHELIEAYDAKRESFKPKDGASASVEFGPLIITKGTVTRMTTEAVSNQYDDDGFNFNISIGGLDIDYDIIGWISGAVGTQTNPFTSGWDDDARTYAEKSTVYLFGRLGLNDYQGTITPKLKVFGIYADPRRCRFGATGGNASLSQFEGDE